ncbi:hypothetical protein PAPYR_4331 [Paratrimastix pyriformis]|uniref:Uncharacterized protein n=1 Tax=Paratrimastix pyriformis TaxID=342808 RepID=A0ABQ8US89_9EUKA|nr:hypothetical protein PAPYR_4331 [Paratrimastix pyriformis]
MYGRKKELPPLVLRDLPPLSVRACDGPIPGSTWLVPGFIAIGPSPATLSDSSETIDRNLNGLLDADVTSFFSVCLKGTELGYLNDVRRLARARMADERRQESTADANARPLCAHPHPTPVVRLDTNGVPLPSSEQPRRTSHERPRHAQQRFKPPFFFRYPTPLGGVCETPDFIRMIDNITLRCLNLNETCYIHSLTGTARIIPVAAVLIARMYLLTADEALAHVERVHLHRLEGPPPTEGQLAKVPRLLVIFRARDNDLIRNPSEAQRNIVFFQPPDDPQWDVNPRDEFEKAMKARSGNKKMKKKVTTEVSYTGIPRKIVKWVEVIEEPEAVDTPASVRQAIGRYDRRHPHQPPPGDADRFAEARLDEPLPGIAPNLNHLVEPPLHAVGGHYWRNPKKPWHILPY